MRIKTAFSKIALVLSVTTALLNFSADSAMADRAAVNRLFGKKFFSQELVEIIEVPVAVEPEEKTPALTLIAKIEVKNTRKKSGQIILAYNYYGELLFEAPCSAGKRGSTPIGTFKFIKQKPRLYSYSLELYANYPSYFGKHLALHAWPIVIKTGKLYQINKLGSPASIGCIRVPEEFAKQIYENIDLNKTELVISA